LRVTIRDSIVEADSKPYSVNEVLIHGTVSGVVVVSKNTGITGNLSVQGDVQVVYEPGGVLIIRGGAQAVPGYKVEVLEHRKGLTVKSNGAKRDIYELTLLFQGTGVTMSITYVPRRITFYCEPGSLELEEKPFSLKIHVKSPGAVAEARVA